MCFCWVRGIGVPEEEVESSNSFGSSSNGPPNGLLCLLARLLCLIVSLAHFHFLLPSSFGGDGYKAWLFQRGVDEVTRVEEGKKKSSVVLSRRNPTQNVHHSGVDSSLFANTINTLLKNRRLKNQMLCIRFLKVRTPALKGNKVLVIYINVVV